MFYFIFAILCETDVISFLNFADEKLNPADFDNLPRSQLVALLLVINVLDFSDNNISFLFFATIARN